MRREVSLQEAKHILKSDAIILKDNKFLFEDYGAYRPNVTWEFPTDWVMISDGIGKESVISPLERECLFTDSHSALQRYASGTGLDFESPLNFI